MQDRKIIIVLGMHRSGTSVISRGIVALGADAGDNLMPASIDNEKGYWEDLDVYNINESILRFLFFSWKDIDELWFNRFYSFLPLLMTVYFDKAVEVINRKLAKNPCIVIKDPRFNVLLPFWQKVFQQCSCDIYYVLAFRDPLETAKSIEKRNSISLNAGLNMWLYNTVQALRFVQHDLLVVSFTSLLANPMDEISRIAGYLSLPIVQDKIEEYIGAFLDKNLYHQHGHISDTHYSSSMHGSILEMFDVLSRWSRQKLTPAYEVESFIEEFSTHLQSQKWINFDEESKYAFRLYIDNGMGFSGNDTLVRKNVKAEGDIEYDLSHIAGIKSFRLQPDDKPCILLLRAFITKEDGRVEKIPISSGNYKYINGDIFLFDDSKPFLILNTNGEKINSIKINYNLNRSTVFLFSLSVLLREDNVRQKAELSQDKIELRRRDEIIKGKDEEMGRMVEAVREKDEELRQRDEIIKGKDEEIGRMAEAVREKDEELRQRDEIIKGKDEEIGRMAEAVREKDEEVKHRDETLNRKNTEIEQKEIAIKQAEAMLAYANQEIISDQLLLMNYERQGIEKRYARLTPFRIIKRLGGFLLHPKRSISYLMQKIYISRSGLFNEEYYLKMNHDLVLSCPNLLRHFILHGWAEGRNPGPGFDTKYYLTHNPDVRRRGMNPLYHYARFGMKEARAPLPPNETGK